MNEFLSCDWGTSSLRLRLVRIPECEVMAEIVSDEGIAASYKQWQKTTTDRRQYYLQTLQNHIRTLESEQSRALTGVTLIISGMASSSIGFVDVPYSTVPLHIYNGAIKTAYIEANDHFNYPVIVLSGVRTEDDVMRGEETQLIGYAKMLNRPLENDLFIFPGTHSKHVYVLNDEIIEVKTFMTGEFFELLSRKSILSASIIASDTFDETGFEKGLKDSIENNLLNTAFRVRTNSLFGKLDHRQNFYYLSGLLIGSELINIASHKPDRINLVCSSHLKQPYVHALKYMGFNTNKITSEINIDETVVYGHYKILKQHLK